MWWLPVHMGRKNILSKHIHRKHPKSVVTKGATSFKKHKNSKHPDVPESTTSPKVNNDDGETSSN